MSIFSRDIAASNLPPLFHSLKEMLEAYVAHDDVMLFKRPPDIQRAAMPPGFTLQRNIFDISGQWITSTNTGVTHITADGVQIDTQRSLITLADGVYYDYSVYNSGGKTWNSYTYPYRITSCPLYEIEWWSDCDTGSNFYSQGYKHTLCVRDIHEGLPTVQPTINGIEQLDGRQIVTEARYIPTYSINIVIPNAAIPGIYGMTTADHVVLYDPSGISVEVTNVEVSVQGQETNKLQRVTISFTRKMDLVVSKGSCCNSSSVLIDPCTGEWVDPIDPEECQGYNITLEVQGDDLIASEHGTPAGSAEITWYYQGVVIGNDISVELNGYGVYKIRIRRGGCVAEAEYVHASLCNLVLNVITNGSIINAIITGGNGGETYNVYHSDTPSGVPGILVRTSSTWTPYIATIEGYYTMEVIDSKGCTATMMVKIELEGEACGHNIQISRSGETLTATTSCGGGVIWRVYLENESGKTLIATTSTVTITDNGLYTFEAECDGCLSDAHIVVTNYDDSTKVIITQWPDTPINVEGTVGIDGTVNIEGSVSIDGCVEQCATGCENVAGTLEDGFMCTNSSDEMVGEVILAPQVTGMTAPLLYCWSTGENTPTITVSPEEETTYSVEIIDANGCMLTLEATVYPDDLDIESTPPDCFNDGLLVHWTSNGSISEVEYEVYDNAEQCEEYDEGDLSLVLTGSDSTGTIDLTGITFDNDLVVRVFPTGRQGCYRETCITYSETGGSAGIGGSFAGCANGCEDEKCNGLRKSALYGNVEDMSYLFSNNADDIYIQIDVFEVNGVDLLGNVNNIMLIPQDEPGSTYSCAGYESWIAERLEDVLLDNNIYDIQISMEEYTHNGATHCLLRWDFPACYTWKLKTSRGPGSVAWIDEVEIHSDGTVLQWGSSTEGAGVGYSSDRLYGIHDEKLYYDCD